MVVPTAPAMEHDLVIGLVLIGVVVGGACRWRLSSASSTEVAPAGITHLVHFGINVCFTGTF